LELQELEQEQELAQGLELELGQGLELELELLGSRHWQMQPAAAPR
jgi:hypothetical protein